MKTIDTSIFMKKHFLSKTLLAVLLNGVVFGAIAEESIEVLRSGIPHDALYDIDINGEIGFAVGNSGLILESKDAGATWTQHERTTKQAFLSVTSKGDRTLIAGQKGTVMSKTGDGAWETLETPFETRIMNIDFNAAGLIVAVGEFGLIHRSKDGGSSWDTVTLDWMQYNDEGYEPHLYDVTVRDDNNVVVVGEFGLILWSEDGGDSFIARHQGDESLFAIHLDADGTGSGYAVGQDNLILRSQDAKLGKRLKLKAKNLIFSACGPARVKWLLAVSERYFAAATTVKTGRALMIFKWLELGIRPWLPVLQRSALATVSYDLRQFTLWANKRELPEWLNKVGK
jgi:photosystem II stability/assembly factor-like uncharacterized protein